MCLKGSYLLMASQTQLPNHVCSYIQNSLRIDQYYYLACQNSGQANTKAILNSKNSMW